MTGCERPALLVTTVAVGSLLAGPAAAQVVDRCSGPNPPAACAQVEIPGEQGDESTPAGGAGGGPQGYAWYDLELGETPDGDLCWTYSVEYRAEPPPPERTAGYVLPRVEEFGTNVGGPDSCPAQEPVFDPAAEAAVFWAGLDPPAATARIRPGRALTGLRGYLELAGPPAMSATTATPLGPLTVTATPTYVVDWGDGSAPTRTASRGVPWPGGTGEITHVYAHAGAVTVRVTTIWSATWRFGGRTGDLPAVAAASTLDLPVVQLQSVRSR